MTKFKTNNYKASALTKMRVAALITAAILALAFIGCKQPVGAKSEESGTSTPKHKVTFSVDGANGTLKAKAEGIAETETSPINVEEGKTVTFTAKANAGYRVKGWTLDGKPITEAGTNTEYKLTVTKSAIVSVSFEISPVEGGAVLILSPYKNNIRIKAVTSDGSAIAVEGCDEKTLESSVEATLYAKGEKVTLKGNITELSCYNNQLVALGVQGLTSLQKLDCSENQLTSLNVQGLTSLQKLTCYNNQLTSLDVQGLTSLQELKCYKNQIESLNVQDLTALQKLDCSNNQLNSLDASSLTSLQELQCGKNKLTSLNVQGLTSLQELTCYNNQLTSLDIQGLTTLKELGCSSNQLTTLDVKGLIALQWLSCNDNQLPELKVQDLPALKRLDCYKNQLTSLNMQGLPALKQLFCNENQLTSLNVQVLTALERLDCYGNKLSTIDVKALTALKYLDCRSNELNAQAMKELLKALPARAEKDYAKACLYTEYHTEGNHKDFTTASEVRPAFDDAKNKKWALRKIDAKGYPADIK